MTTMSTTAATTTTSRLRAGLALSAFLGLLGVAFVGIPTDGQESPPVVVIVLSAVLGLVQVACAVIAWRTGNRLAIRINAAVLIINALLSVPAFFVDIDAWIKAIAALSVILTVVALVLTLRRESTPYTVTD
jgi:CRISPR-associated Cas5-like protein